MTGCISFVYLVHQQKCKKKKRGLYGGVVCVSEVFLNKQQLIHLALMQVARFMRTVFGPIQAQ